MFVYYSHQSIMWLYICDH